MKILLAIDGSSQSEQALLEVVSRPWPEGSHIKAVTAYYPPPYYTPEVWGMTSRDTYTMARTHLLTAAEEIVDRAHSILSSGLDRKIHLEKEVLEGEPRKAILDAADSWGADLIIVGAQGHGAVSRFLLGSVSNALVHHAKCSVEIVRRRETN